MLNLFQHPITWGNEIPKQVRDDNTGYDQMLLDTPLRADAHLAHGDAGAVWGGLQRSLGGGAVVGTAAGNVVDALALGADVALDLACSRLLRHYLLAGRLFT